MLELNLYISHLIVKLYSLFNSRISIMHLNDGIQVIVIFVNKLCYLVYFINPESFGAPFGLIFSLSYNSFLWQTKISLNGTKIRYICNVLEDFYHLVSFSYHFKVKHPIVFEVSETKVHIYTMAKNNTRDT